ncbi:ipk protein [Gloeopeniophorella convolvens]|nr:ipk protein [Gloeopeniophorella convolvens]
MASPALKPTGSVTGLTSGEVTGDKPSKVHGSTNCSAPSETITVYAPAKLNLFLHVTGRRSDGYHTLQTAFQLLDYCDELEITPRDDEQLTLRCERDCATTLLDDAALAALDGPENLVLRAARSLQATTGTRLGAVITLRKRIPVGSGLGGGSADAAAALVGLARVWDVRMSRAELAALGGRLGADVPVLVHGQSAWGEGTGVELASLALAPRIFLVVYPAVCALTGPVFTHPDLMRATPRITREAFEAGEVETRNDLQPIAETLFPPIAVAIRWLSQFAPARMSGSGSSVFASFDSVEAAQQVLEQVPEPWGAFIAHGLDTWDHFTGRRQV